MFALHLFKLSNDKKVPVFIPLPKTRQKEFLRGLVLTGSLFGALCNGKSLCLEEGGEIRFLFSPLQTHKKPYILADYMEIDWSFTNLPTSEVSESEWKKNAMMLVSLYPTEAMYTPY